MSGPKISWGKWTHSGQDGVEADGDKKGRESRGWWWANWMSREVALGALTCDARFSRHYRTRFAGGNIASCLHGQAARGAFTGEMVPVHNSDDVSTDCFVGVDDL